MFKMELFSSMQHWVSSLCHAGSFTAGHGLDAVVHRLSTPRPMMPTRNWTWVPCMARQILNHWTTRETPHVCFLSTSCLSSPEWNFCIPITWNQGMTWWISLYPLQMQAFSRLSEDLCILPIQLILFLFVLIPVAYLFYFFVMPQGMSDLSSLTTGWTCTPCIARVKS